MYCRNQICQRRLKVKMLELNKIYNIDNVDGMMKMDSESIDLTITSPPYDDLRNYNGYSFDFKNVAKELYRVTKEGGICVWIVNDATINGSKSGTSFEQALFFKEIGFNIHDVMIWNKPSFTSVGSIQTRYPDVFEYMFVFSKGKPKTFNPIKDRINKCVGNKKHGNIRQKDGSMKNVSSLGRITLEKGIRFNVWNIPTANNVKERYNHPAPFPQQLVRDHILSWSSEGDVVLDPFMGSGTTAVVARALRRNYIGFEISKDYCDIAQKRIELNKSFFDLDYE